MKENKAINNIPKEIFLHKREKNTHKGQYGKVLVIAGCVGMAGAAQLCGKAAIKSGAGIVRFLAPREIFDILQVGVPEATCIDRRIEEDVNLDEYDAIAIGSGLGQGKENIRIIKKVLNEYSKTLIIDADALNCIMKYSLYGNLTMTNANVILTPHLVEAARLLEIEKVEDDMREDSGKELRQIFDATVVMKGSETQVFGKDEIYTNTTGNPGMATGGSGDVLSGIIASLAAQGYSEFESSKLGVYIHGLAGDMASFEMGEMGMTAMDIVTFTPLAIKEIYNKDQEN